ncbi:MAG: Histidinol-phosphatase [uncultured Thermomicrobiales bacterium]|uniref:Histidinol-phosphatase n=1 Tax=uncultured Thermomicrobiales bacterium TaxID=1645740 RepID=A0A6J4VBR1_9BACT|nr:MAG: Histidinol-phosphatase [uncultured Thermomicrobiales bacterium]
MFDYHVHTTQSADCSTPILASCAAAVERGLSEIAFTDHIEHEPADMSYGFFNYDTYMANLQHARSVFGDRLVILAGAEVDFNRRIASEVRDFVEAHEFDFVIGSVHYGEEGQIIFPEYFDTRDLEDVFVPYYEEIRAAVETGLFDTIGHIDLPKRYAPGAAGAYDPLRFEDELTSIFELMIRQEMSFEINTSGIRQAPRTSMPGPQIVSLYARLGGRLVTVGSDSHVPDTIGAGFPQTLRMLELCGIDSVSSFRRRQRSQVPVVSLL